MSPWQSQFFVCVLTEYSEAAEESEDESTDVTQEVETTDEDTIVISTIAALTTEIVTEPKNYTLIDEEDTQLELILMVMIPLVFLAFLLLSVVLIIINYKRGKAKQGKYLCVPNPRQLLHGSTDKH